MKAPTEFSTVPTLYCCMLGMIGDLISLAPGMIDWLTMSWLVPAIAATEFEL